MGDEHDAEPRLAVEPAEEPDALRLIAQIEVGRRLVEDEQARPLGQGPREHHALALAPAQPVEPARPRRSSTPVAAMASRARARSSSLSKKRPRRVRIAAHQHQLLDGERKSLRDVLRHHRDLPGHLGPRESAAASAPVEQDLAPRRAPATRDRRRISVVLPEALGPITPKISPGLDGQR